MSWADDYRAGRHEDVWQAMLAAGPDLRQDPAAWDDARAVATETMRRVRATVERVYAVLLSDGYVFSYPSEALVVPQEDAAALLDEVEQVVGPVSLALRAWIETVGSVNLMGEHPDWSFEYTDPLVVECSAERIVAEYEERLEVDWFEEEGTGQFPMHLAPDYLHKADVSGGSPYSTWLPEAAVDGRWEFDDLHDSTFVEYLRSTLLRWGGFPGWARQEPVWAAPAEPWPQRLAELTKELEPF